MYRRYAALLAWLAWSSACNLTATYEGSRFRCDGSQDCPASLVCTGGYCQPPDNGGGDGGAADDLATIGNLLEYPFDGAVVEQAQIAHDRSGHGRDGLLNTNIMPAMHGNAASMELDETDYIEIPDHPDLFLGRAFTIEMWIQPNFAGAMSLLTDEGVDTGTAEAVVEITAAGELRFASYPCPATERVELTSPPDLIAAAQWTHVAVTREQDGAVTLYVNAEQVASSSFDPPCPIERDILMGRTKEGTNYFIGLLDEVKLSDHAKSATDLAASMAFDSSTRIPRCGDRFVDDSETCEIGALCCSASECIADDDQSEGCTEGGAGECNEGVCLVPGGKVTEDLIGDYLFDEGGGESATDSLGNLPSFAIVSDTAWGEGYVELSGEPMVTPTPPAAFLEACAASNEVTMEAWVSVANTTPVDGIIVDVSNTASMHELVLRQRSSYFSSGIRSSRSSSAGKPEIAARPDNPLTDISHLLVTRSADGWRRFYINGVLRASSLVGGELTCPADATLGMGNDALDTGNDAFFGRIYRLSLYSRALSAREAAQNFTADM